MTVSNHGPHEHNRKSEMTERIEPAVTALAAKEAAERWPHHDDDAYPYSKGAYIGFLRGAEWAADQRGKD